MNWRWVTMLVVSGSSLTACTTTATRHGEVLQSLQSLQPRQDDAVVLGREWFGARSGEAAIRLEPSSRVRLLTHDGADTGWFAAETLELSQGSLSWMGARGALTLHLADIQSIEVETFDRIRSLLLIPLIVAMMGVSSLGALGGLAQGDRTTSKRGFTRSAGQTPGDLQASKPLFTGLARRADMFRFVIGQDLGGGSGVGWSVDLFSFTRLGIRLRDFVEVSIGLRVQMPNLSQKAVRPLQPPELSLVPGFMSRLAFFGALDPDHRVALVLGGEIGFDGTVVGRLLWGVQLRPVGQLHVTVLPMTVLFSPSGQRWAHLSVDTSWHF